MYYISTFSTTEDFWQQVAALKMAAIIRLIIYIATLVFIIWFMVTVALSLKYISEELRNKNKMYYKIHEKELSQASFDVVKEIQQEEQENIEEEIEANKKDDQ